MLSVAVSSTRTPGLLTDLLPTLLIPPASGRVDGIDPRQETYLQVAVQYQNISNSQWGEPWHNETSARSGTTEQELSAERWTLTRWKIQGKMRRTASSTLIAMLDLEISPVLDAVLYSQSSTASSTHTETSNRETTKGGWDNV